MLSAQNFKYYIPSLGQVWGLVLVFVLATLVASPVSFVIKGTSAAYLASFVLIFLWIMFQGKRCRKAGGVPLRLDVPDFGGMNPILFFVVIALMVLALGILVEPLTSMIPMSDFFKRLFEKAFDSSNPVDLVLATTILAPLCEELLCRGIMLRGLLARMSPVKAILWSAFVFAFIHMNPWQSIPAFAIACFLGWIYYRTHSLWACIFMHFVNNGTSALLMLLLPDAEFDVGYADILPTNGYIALLLWSAIVLVVGIFLLNKKLNKNEKALSFKVQATAQE